MPTLINICGTERSGSTMIDVMLGNGNDAFSCGEVYAHFRPFCKHHYSINCPCQSKPCQVWDKIGNVPSRNFHSNAAKVLGRDFIIDSSKDLAWLLDATQWSLQHQMSVINIVTWKDPIGFTYSSWKRGKDHAWWRDPFVAYYQYFIDLGIPFIAVSIDDLLQDPPKYLEMLCNATGINYYSGKEFFWEKQQHQLFGSPSVREAVMTGRGSIKPPRQFDDEFKKLEKTYIDKIEKDIDVSQLIATLKEHDITNWKKNDPRFGPVPPIKIKKPKWYYKMRLNQFWHRLAPLKEPDT